MVDMLIRRQDHNPAAHWRFFEPQRHPIRKHVAAHEFQRRDVEFQQQQSCKYGKDHGRTPAGVSFPKNLREPPDAEPGKNSETEIRDHRAAHGDAHAPEKRQQVIEDAIKKKFQPSE